LNNTLYSSTINGVVFSYTSDADATAAEIAGGLISAINGGTEPVTASGTTTVVLTADQAGVGFTATATSNLANVATTANVGPVEDLQAISEENDDWYGLMMISRDNLEILSVAGYIETQRKFFLACTDDAGVLAAGSTDIASKLQARNYARTAYLYSGDEANYPEAAWLGRQLPEDPGSSTWKFKTLVGIVADNLTGTQQSFAEGKNANIYTKVGGVDITSEGKVAEGEFIDVIIGVDWIEVNMQADIYTALVSEKKVPYTDQGVGVIENIVRSVLQQAVTRQILAADPSFTVSVPLVANVPQIDKAQRILRNVNFEATLAGAIHAVVVRGNVSV
jgi:hypothetical protein